MKTIMMALCLSVACIATMNAQDKKTEAYQQYKKNQREEIQPKDLPEAIKTSLQDKDYFGWKIAKAYRGLMNDPDDLQAPGKEIYVIDLQRGSKTTSVTFDREGNRLDRVKKD